MKKVFQAISATVLTAAIIFCFISTSSAQTGLTKIADGVYSYIDEKKPSPMTSFGANAGIIIGKDGIVVVDTLISAKAARRFIKDIRAISKKPIRYVVNTHDHLDHALGNSEFVKRGAVIVAHKEAKAAMQKSGDGMIQYAKKVGLSDEFMAGTVVMAPSLTFSDVMEIDLGDRNVRLIHMGGPHSAGDVVVYIPDSKTLFTGDILFTNFHPYMGDGNIEAWTTALDRIDAMDVANIIPGHGPVSSKKDVVEMKNYIVTFDRNARELLQKLNEPDQIAVELKKALPERTFFDTFIGANVKGLYFRK